MFSDYIQFLFLDFFFFINIIYILGKFIPASQRPDGTWRKARRVKDGYVPQEEVPLYESKGKQFAKKPDLPVGLCPLIAKASREKRERQQQKQNKIPGLITPTTTNKTTGPGAHNNQDNRKEKRQTGGGNNGAGNQQASKKVTHQKENNVHTLNDALAAIDLNSEENVVKQLKKLRKKIREIEAIEEKLKKGDLKNPEQDQLDKVARKLQIVKEIKTLEALQPGIAASSL